MSAWLPKQAVSSAPSGPNKFTGEELGKGGLEGGDTPAQHNGGAVGEVVGSGAVTETLQCEAKADEARADGEAEFEQEAEQEVVLGLQGEGDITPGS